MNSNTHSTEKENLSEEIRTDGLPSLEDFIRELEEKEKDLDISDETVVEIEEYVAPPSNLFEILTAETHAPQNNFPNSASSGNGSNNSQPAASAATTGAETEVAELRRRIATLEKERTETSETARRKSFDYDNYRKRVEREKGEVFRGLLGNVGTQLLPVLDNLSRALDSAEGLENEKSNDFLQFIDGIELVNQQLAEVLEEMGIQAIPAVGEPFDPHFHEAVAVEKTDEFPPQTVVAELLRGYRLDDKVIRHAMVKVSAALDS